MLRPHRPLAALAVAVAAICLPAAPAAATQWDIDPDHAEVGFAVKHLMVNNVRGNFHQITGAIEADDKDIAKSSVSVTIAVSSLTTGTPKRDDHLKSPDFLDAAKFPNITFKSTKVQKHGKQLKVQGELTIRDVTRPATLLVDGPSAPIKDPWGMTRVALSATTKFNRKDFGLTWNKALETGGVVVGEDVMVEINAEFIKKEAAKPAP